MSEQLLDGYVSREQLAKELGKALRTIDRWERRRIGPPRVVIGRMILYRKEAVREWLLSQEQQRKGKNARPGDSKGARLGLRRQPAQRSRGFRPAA
jgi:predicted DNA-binding transcriptional regulator AlpA